MGLVARALEENGISTITLTPTPEFNREIGFPRIAAIEYPYGRPIGQIHDKEGQRQVLLKTLEVLQECSQAGQVYHLPFRWPEDPRKTNWHPPEISPIVKTFLDEIKKAGAASRK